MKKQITLVFLTTLLLLTAPQAFALDAYEKSLSDTTTVDSQKLVLNGYGLREATIFKIDVYLASLFLAEKSTDANKILNSTSPKVLILDFYRDVSAEKMKGAWQSGFENIATPEIKDNAARLIAGTPEVKENQTFKFIFKDGSCSARMAGSAQLDFEGNSFCKALLSIWLGANPPGEKLKRGLLGVK